MKKFKNQRLCRAVCLLLCAVMTLGLGIGAFAVSGAAADNLYKDARFIVGGVPFGVKFCTEGVVVIGFSDIDNISKSQNPAYLAGLRPKDVITEINGVKISDSASLIKIIEDSGGQTVSLTYRRAGSEMKISLTPVFSKSDNKYKTGIWVRDSGAGIGTVTYIDPVTREFGGLGHGICDGETGELIPMSRGIVSDVKISQIKKGIAGAPGEIKGHFGIERWGSLIKNTDCGVFGVLAKIPDEVGEAVPIGTRTEVRSGEAEIICTLDDGVRATYKIEIGTVNKDSTNSKSFVIKVKDPALIEKTGGIVQGMSGSPIVQNGKLIGAVTHVMINDPTVGYGIFIENMLNAAQMPMARAS